MMCLSTQRKQAMKTTQAQVTAEFKAMFLQYGKVDTNHLIQVLNKKRAPVPSGSMIEIAAKEVMGQYEYSRFIYNPVGTAAKLLDVMKQSGYTGYY